MRITGASILLIFASISGCKSAPDSQPTATRDAEFESSPTKVLQPVKVIESPAEAVSVSEPEQVDPEPDRVAAKPQTQKGLSKRRQVLAAAMESKERQRQRPLASSVSVTPSAAPVEEPTADNDPMSVARRAYENLTPDYPTYVTGDDLAMLNAPQYYAYGEEPNDEAVEVLPTSTEKVDDEEPVLVVDRFGRVQPIYRDTEDEEYWGEEADYTGIVYNPFGGFSLAVLPKPAKLHWSHFRGGFKLRKQREKEYQWDLDPRSEDQSQVKDKRYGRPDLKKSANMGPQPWWP